MLARLNKRNILKWITIIYTIAIVILTLYSYSSSADIIEIRLQQGDFNSTYNLIPFKTIITYCSNYKRYNLSIILRMLISNIILFIPYGILLNTVLYKRSIFQNLILLISVRSLVEISQFVLKVGFFDIDSIISCIIAYLLGVLVFLCIKQVSNTIPKKS